MEPTVEELGGYPSAEALRFYRLIEERETGSKDGTQMLKLACGHSVTRVVIPDTQKYVSCARCIAQWATGDKFP